VNTEYSETDFRTEVTDRMKQKGESFIMALYAVLDEWTARGIEAEETKPACHGGCSFCCHQLVSSTAIEWVEIRSFILGLSATARYWLTKRIKKRLPEWHTYFKEFDLKIRTHQRNPLNDWMGKPCVFLNAQGQCDIYPVRPIDCRTFSSTIVCSNETKGDGVQRCRFPWELWANNWLLEYQAKLANTSVMKVEILILNDRLAQDSILWK